MIGMPLVSQLVNSGHEVIVLTRKKTENYQEKNPFLVNWDGCTLGDWVDRVGDVEAIINLAGENIGARLWTRKRKIQIIESRLRSSKVLVDFVKQRSTKIKVFIQGSAIGYYPKNLVHMITECDPPGDDYFSEICEKWENESVILDEMNIRRVVIRTGVVLSRTEGALQRISLPILFFIGGPIGDGRQFLTWIHPFDVISAIQFLLENEAAQGIYNLTSPNPVANKELGQILARKLHRPYWFPVPAFILKTLLGEMSSMVLDGQKVIPERLSQAGFQYKYGSIPQAIDDLFIE